MSNPPFSYGLASKKGSYHAVNCDAIVALTWSDVPQFSGQNVGLFIVADGEYAAESGISASQLATQIISEEIKTSIFQPSDSTISEIMTAAVQKAHQQIIAEVTESSTTLTAALIIDNQLTIAHVGGSRAYYAYGKYLIQLTDDHRFLQRLIDQGHYTWEQVARGEVYIDNVLYRTLGQSETLEVDILTERLAEGSCVLLSTDGLSRSQGNYISDMQLLSVIQNNPPQLACDTLINLAQKAGSTDDVSVILIKMSRQQFHVPNVSSNDINPIMTPFRLTYGLASEKGNTGFIGCDTAVARTWSNGVGFFAVADGMGREGKKASQLACDIVMREMDTYFQEPYQAPISSNDKPFSLLKSAIQTANREVIAQTPDSGTTFTAALAIGGSLYVTHVGDSRAYLMSKSGTQQLTDDHMYSQALLRGGFITEEELKSGHIHDVLYRALGQTEPVEVDTRLTNIIPNTWLMLCTRGLISWNWAGVNLEEIYATLSQNEPQLATDILVGLSSAHESYLDISIIIVRFDAP